MSQPSAPSPPNMQQSYAQGIQTYLQYLPEMLNTEMADRYKYDPQRIAEQQGLQAQFGPTQYAQMLDALKALDPTGYALREQTGAALSKDLAAGSNLTSDQSQALEQQIRRSSAARGNTYGQAPVQAEAFTKGMYGMQLYQQRLQNAMNFQNSATPESWATMVPPVSADRSMAYVNPNAGFQGEQFALQNYQNQLAASQMQGNSGSSWGSGIGSILGMAAGAYFGGPMGAQMGGSLGGSLGGGIGSIFSDKRIKTNISKVGTAPSGVGLYRYKPKFGGQPMIGAIAQNVAKTRPDAVSVDPQSGLLKVDYTKLGLPGFPVPAAIQPANSLTGRSFERYE